MPKPDQSPEDSTNQPAAPEHQGPSFEKLMQLVFSRPIYLEPSDESEETSEAGREETESEPGREVEEESETEPGGEAQPQ
jgi:hypothetical protein